MTPGDIFNALIASVVLGFGVAIVCGILALLGFDRHLAKRREKGDRP